MLLWGSGQPRMRCPQVPSLATLLCVMPWFTGGWCRHTLYLCRRRLLTSAAVWGCAVQGSPVKSCGRWQRQPCSQQVPVVVVLGQEVEPKLLHAGAGLWGCTCLGGCSALDWRLAPQGGQWGQLAGLRPLRAPCKGRLGVGLGAFQVLMHLHEAPLHGQAPPHAAGSSAWAGFFAWTGSRHPF